MFAFRYIGPADKLALLLDYDGTLAPIAPHPDLAILPLETKSVLERLANTPEVFVAIVSGRNVEDVKEKVGHFEAKLHEFVVVRDEGFCNTLRNFVET